jgi:hypothetical protein
LDLGLTAELDMRVEISELGVIDNLGTTSRLSAASTGLGLSIFDPMRSPVEQLDSLPPSGCLFCAGPVSSGRAISTETSSQMPIIEKKLDSFAGVCV